jgi:hypothetical protein
MSSPAVARAFGEEFVLKKLFVSVMSPVRRKVAISLSTYFNSQNCLMISNVISHVLDASVSMMLMLPNPGFDT